MKHVMKPQPCSHHSVQGSDQSHRPPNGSPGKPSCHALAAVAQDDALGRNTCSQLQAAAQADTVGDRERTRAVPAAQHLQGLRCWGGSGGGGGGGIQWLKDLRLRLCLEFREQGPVRYEGWRQANQQVTAGLLHGKAKVEVRLLTSLTSTDSRRSVCPVAKVQAMLVQL